MRKPAFYDPKRYFRTFSKSEKLSFQTNQTGFTVKGPQKSPGSDDASEPQPAGSRVKLPKTAEVDLPKPRFSSSLMPSANSEFLSDGRGEGLDQKRSSGQPVIRHIFKV